MVTSESEVGDVASPEPEGKDVVTPGSTGSFSSFDIPPLKNQFKTSLLVMKMALNVILGEAKCGGMIKTIRVALTRGQFGVVRLGSRDTVWADQCHDGEEGNKEHSEITLMLIGFRS